jgi:hypothetical protein
LHEAATPRSLASRIAFIIPDILIDSTSSGPYVVCVLDRVLYNIWPEEPDSSV